MCHKVLQWLQHPPKFWLSLKFWSLPWYFPLLLQTFKPISQAFPSSLNPFSCLTNCRILACSTYVMFTNLFWWFQRLVFLYTSCPSHVNTCCTHTKSLKHCRTSVVTVIQRSISSVTHVTSCHETVTPSVMLYLIIPVVYVVMSSKNAKCVTHISLKLEKLYYKYIIRIDFFLLF